MKYYLEELGQKPLNKAPSLHKLIGPSFILLGLGLGSGEIILWPYLISNFGLGLAWAAILGITIQFILNTEISRYTLVNGESIFVGFARKFKIASPIFFILTTFIPWMWPGIIATIAHLLINTLNIPYTPLIPIGLLIFLGFLYSLGKIIYKTQELILKAIIIFGVPFLFVIALLVVDKTSILELFRGIIGIGEGYRFLPKDIPFAVFLGALAYAGAGGTLNLAQSFYVKEKGFGMGKHQGRIVNIFSNSKQTEKLEGDTFLVNKESLSLFNEWWKKINIEHFLVFLLTGIFTILLLMLLAYSTVYKSGITSQGVDFILQETLIIGQKTSAFISIALLVALSVMLFGTQFSVFGSTSRIMTENLLLLSKNRFHLKNASKYFYVFLWLQILIGIIIFIFGFGQPLLLVVIGAVMNAFTMFIYTGMILYLNYSSLHKKLRPSLIRIAFLCFSFLFYGGFTIVTIFNYL